MAYTKTTWVNDSPPDINAENLNKMEQGIADAQFPEGGTTGQVLKKTENGIAWGNDEAGTDAVWGNITGNMADQTDLNNALSTLNEEINSLAGSLAMVETSTATANHAVGDLIVYNNQLYKVTAAIASGEAIVVGTNVSATNVSGELIPLTSLLHNYETNVIYKGTAPSASIEREISLTGVYFLLTNDNNQANLYFITGQTTAAYVRTLFANSSVITVTISGTAMTITTTGGTTRYFLIKLGEM